MVAYVLAANATLRDIGNASIWGVATARAGGDTIDTNGFKITIDQDCRYGLSGTTSTTWGNMTINASKGGEIHFDGTKVWMIPFTGGSGTLTLGTQITIGGVTCNTIGIYTSLTAAPATTGASGWLKVTNASATPGTISDGTYAGFTLTANGAAVRGFIEINGDDSASIIANRLGVFRVTGAWYSLGTTSGSSNQTLQIPNNGLNHYCPGVFIEKTAGQQDYEFYPNNGVNTSTGTDATRGKVVWIDNTGLVRIGNSGAATNGYTPAAGLEVVVPNIFFQCNTTAARTANVLPNATIATRYDFTSTGGGVIEIDKGSFAWYLSLTQAYSVNISNSGFIDAILLSEVATAMTLTKVGVGNKPTTVLNTWPLSMTYCYAGGTFTDCVWTRATWVTNTTICTITDSAGFTFVRDKVQVMTALTGGGSVGFYPQRCRNFTLTDPVNIGSSIAIRFSASTDCTVTGTVYCQVPSGTTVNQATYVFYAETSTNVTFSGLSLPVTNTHPYAALMYAALSCNGIKLRNIGTYASPLNLGTVNACGLVYQLATYCSNVKVQRVYTSNTRTGIISADNSNTGVTEENVWGDYADAVDVMACLNMKRKGMGGTGVLTAQTSVYGTHFYDSHTSTTAGRIAILMNEPTAQTSSQVTLANGAAFTSAGGLYMPTVGMSATFEVPEYIIGHTGFSGTAGTMAGGTVGNYRFEYAIDKNDGNGFSALTASSYTAAQLATAMNAITGIDAALGFKLKIKISTTTGNTTAITSFYMLTTSTTTTQAYQYPLDTNTLTLTGVLTGSEIRCFTGSPGASAVEIGGIESSSGNFVLTHSAGDVAGFISIIHPDRQAFSLGIDSAFTYSAADVTIPISQVLDRNYTY